jgi:hypothetical protein
LDELITGVRELLGILEGTPYEHDPAAAKLRSAISDESMERLAAEAHRWRTHVCLKLT